MSDVLYRVASRQTVPPGKWRITIEETGTKLVDLSYYRLRHRYYQHCIANGLPLGRDWQEKLDDRLCRELGIEGSHCTDEPLPEKDIPVMADGHVMGIGDLFRFLGAVEEWLRSGMQFVPQQQAEARAAVCASCPLNVEVGGCKGCAGVLKKTLELVNKTTSRDDQLENCGACGCVLRAKVHMPLEFNLTSQPPGTEYPEHCWMEQEQKESGQYDIRPLF